MQPLDSDNIQEIMFFLFVLSHYLQQLTFILQQHLLQEKKNVTEPGKPNKLVT